MEVIELQPEIDYVKIGQRIKSARLEHGYSQADLGAWWLVRWYIFSSIVCTDVCHRKSSMFRINIPVRDMIAMTSI